MNKPNNFRKLQRNLRNTPQIFKDVNIEIPKKSLWFDNTIESIAPTSQREARVLEQSKKGSKSPSITNADLAKIIIEEHIFMSISDTLYHWCEDKGIYKTVTTEYAEKFIRSHISDQYKHKINSISIKEIIRWIESFVTPIDIELLELNKRDLIALSNGLYNFKKQRFIQHNHKYFFTSVINAKYSNDSKPSSIYFEKFMSDITNNDHNLYLRIQELFGYVISEIRSVKCIPYLIGPKDTGKSIILKILEYLVGKESFTNLSFEQLNKPEYLAQIIGKRLNTCGETSEFKLNKLDTFKKLSGGDYITARPIYNQPINFVNSAVLLFAGNHLPEIKGLDKSNAFSKRITVFPFTNPIPKEKQDTQLFEKLITECDYIVLWAIEGLKRWRAQNFEFTSTYESDDLSNNYYERNNSIESFINSNCTFNSKFKIHKSTFEDAYLDYCDINVIAPESSTTLHDYILSLPGISYSRFRIGDNNKRGYKGISLKNGEKEDDVDETD
ncbi:MAG: phage/plasmid primase, P4 family [Solibacillus sp.]